MVKTSAAAEAAAAPAAAASVSESKQLSSSHQSYIFLPSFFRQLWEQSFDTAVDNCVDGLLPAIGLKSNKAVEKLILSMLLAAIVIPSWRLFILPEQQELAKMEKEND